MDPGSRPPPEDDTAFFGRPKGLLTRSGLKVWERFSFLGMQAILVPCFADSVANEGMGMSAGTAASVSAARGTLVHLVSVAGGRLADRMLGTYRAVKLYDDVSKPARFGVNGVIAVGAGLAVMAAAPCLRRTTHPVH